MSIIIELVDYDTEPEEFDGDWELTGECLICYEDGRPSNRTIIPLHNVYRITETLQTREPRTW